MARGMITAGKDALDKVKGAWDFTKGMAQFALTPASGGGAGPQSIARITPDLGASDAFTSWKEGLSEGVWGETEEMMDKFTPGQYEEPESRGLRDAIRHFLLTEKIGLPAATAYEFFESGGQKSDFINNLEADRLKKRIQPFLPVNASPDEKRRLFGEYAAQWLANEFKNPGSTELKNVVFPDAENDPTIWDWQDRIKQDAFDLGGNIQSNIVQPIKKFFGGDTETPEVPQNPMENLQRNFAQNIQATKTKLQPPKQYTVEPYLGDRPGRQPKPVDAFSFEDTRARATRPTTPAPSTTPVRGRTGGIQTRRGFIPPRRSPHG